VQLKAQSVSAGLGLMPLIERVIYAN